MYSAVQCSVSLYSAVQCSNVEYGTVSAHLWMERRTGHAKDERPEGPNSEHGIVSIVHCTEYSVQCKLYTVHCTVYNVNCTLYNVLFTVYTVCIPCTM